MDRRLVRLMDGQADRQSDGWTVRCTGRPTDRRTDRRTNEFLVELRSRIQKCGKKKNKADRHKSRARVSISHYAEKSKV